MAGLPRLRNDLIISRQQASDGGVVIVKDPVSGDFFRFHEAEYFIATQFDGTTALDEVRRRTEARFEAALAPEMLARFRDTLDRAGLLDSATRPRRRSARQRRVRGTVLRIRFKAFDPHRLFRRLLRRVGFCFTPSFVCGSALVILVAAVTLAGSWPDARHDLSRLYHIAAIPAFLAVIACVGSAHEFAHGLTCTYFGGEVHEMGFMFIYFQPAFYCNVSDAWLFPERSQRMWVSFAGPYFELCVWALATLLWRVTEPETTINFIALIVMAGSGITTLFNFNPFIKLDGYYLLSDYLGIPNLRRRAFRYIGSLIQRLFGAGELPEAPATARERRILLLYGAVASASTFALLAYILVTAGGYLFKGHQPLAVLGTTTYVVLKFRRRFLRFFGSRSGALDAGDDDEDDDADLQPGGGGTTAAEPPARRSHDAGRKRWRRGHTWLAAAAAIVPLLFVVHVRLRVGGPFTVLPLHNADVRTEIDGIVESVYVTEGVHVRAGDLIARLYDRETRAQLEQTQADLAQARARLRLLLAGATPDSIALARTSLQKATDALKYVAARFARDSALAQMGALSRLDLETTQSQADAARGNLAEAQAQLQAMLRGARPEEIDAARAQVARLEALVRFVSGQLQRVDVRSPATGVVATPVRQLHDIVGQGVQKGTLIAKVFDLDKLTVDIAVPEGEVADVREGAAVAFKARAYPNETFRGTVTAIATTALAATGPADAVATIPEPATSTTPKTVLVTTEIDNPAGLLKPGMTGHAKIDCGPRRIVDLAARRLARTVKVDFWSWW